MEIKDMREALKEIGSVPRSNEDVVKFYNEKFKETKVVSLVSNNIYTYVGSGDEPPHMTNFMGLQKFVRGQATEVRNPEVLKKISHHKCFVKGKVDTEEMFKNDEREKKKAQDQRDEDVKTQIQVDRIKRGLSS